MITLTQVYAHFTSAYGHSTNSKAAALIDILSATSSTEYYSIDTCTLYIESRAAKESGVKKALASNSINESTVTAEPVAAVDVSENSTE